MHSTCPLKTFEWEKTITLCELRQAEDDRTAFHVTEIETSEFLPGSSEEVLEGVVKTAFYVAVGKISKEKESKLQIPLGSKLWLLLQKFFSSNPGKNLEKKARVKLFSGLCAETF